MKWPVRLNKLAEARTIRGFKLIFAALFQYSKSYVEVNFRC